MRSDRLNKFMAEPDPEEGHLALEDLMAYMEGTLQGQDRESAEFHLSFCDVCQLDLAVFQEDARREAVEAVRKTEPQKVSRSIFSRFGWSLPLGFAAIAATVALIIVVADSGRQRADFAAKLKAQSASSSEVDAIIAETAKDILEEGSRIERVAGAEADVEPEPDSVVVGRQVTFRWPSLGEGRLSLKSNAKTPSEFEPVQTGGSSGTTLSIQLPPLPEGRRTVLYRWNVVTSESRPQPVFFFINVRTAEEQIQILRKSPNRSKAAQ